MTVPLLLFWRSITVINNLSDFHKKTIEIIKNEAKNRHIKAYIAGGAVRDLILKREIKDIDFLVEASAVDFVKRGGFKIKSIHKDFDTAKIEIEGKEFDVASTRVEKYPFMGCLPVVSKIGTSIEKDLRRRDFTINSIGYNIIENKIIDPYSGVKDIENKTLRVLHNNSYKDDPTRILRGLDFKYRFGFDFSINDKKLIDECINTFDNEHLSIDRIYLTLNKIFSSSYPDKILDDILNKKIYKIWMKKTVLRPDDTKELMNAARIFNITEINKLFIMALDSIPYIKAPLKNDYEIFSFFKKFSALQCAFYYFKTGDKNALRYLEIKDIKPYLTGKTLLDNGFSQGKIIGDILEDIQREKLLNKNLNSIKDELEYVFKKYK